MNTSVRSKRLTDVFLFTSLLPLFGLLLNRQDIFFLDVAFHWLVIPPVILALRYGFMGGISSLLLILFYVFLAAVVGFSFHNEQLTHFFLGTMILVLICSEFSHRWQLLLYQHNKDTRAATQHVRKMESSLELLKLSHTRLEESLVHTHQTLSHHLKALDAIQVQQDTVSLSQFGQPLHDILSDFEWLTACAFYPVQQGQIQHIPIATIGAVQIPDSHDGLIKLILSRKANYCYHKTRLFSESISQYHASFAVADASENLHGLLIIYDILPKQLSKSHIQLLRSLCQYLGHLLTPADKELALYRPLLIKREIDWSLNLIMHHVNFATLILVTVSQSELSEKYEKFFIKNIRHANKIWRLNEENIATRLLMLLPVFDLDDYKDYQKQLNKVFANEHNSSINNAGIVMDYHYVNHRNKDSVSSLLNNLGDIDYAKTIR